MLEFHAWMRSMGFELIHHESVDFYQYNGVESVITVRGRGHSVRVEVDSCAPRNPLAGQVFTIDCYDRQVGLDRLIRCIQLIFIETR